MPNILGNSIPIAIWTLFGVAAALTGGRFVIRLRVFRRFFWDDLTHLIALLALLGFAVSTQEYVLHVKTEVAVAAGEIPMPADFATIKHQGRQYQVALSTFAWISLWAVKFTFLLFYRLLFEVSEKFVKAWWITVVFTFATFWIPIAGVLTACGAASQLYNDAACKKDPFYQQQLLEYSCAFQVVTDLLSPPTVMALPLSMLHRIRVQPMQRLGLIMIFGIALVTVALEILRTVESVQILHNSNETIEGTKYASSILFAILEISFSVIISCLPVYRALFTYEKRRKDSWAMMRAGERIHGVGGSGSGGGGNKTYGSQSTEHGRQGSSTLVHPVTSKRDSWAKWDGKYGNASANATTTTRGLHEHYPNDEDNWMEMGDKQDEQHADAVSAEQISLEQNHDMRNTEADDHV
ncbi:hypothetical protein MMC25_003811 [Agyrium rufum]|nr:hypothetical protein [Agyrium rufum]